MNRIPCPHCGERDLEEFYYGGDAGLKRPAQNDQSIENWHDFVYLRDNPRGPHDELWYHSFGCRRWFKLVRDTLTHEILSPCADVNDATDKSAQTELGDRHA